MLRIENGCPGCGDGTGKYCDSCLAAELREELHGRIHRETAINGIGEDSSENRKHGSISPLFRSNSEHRNSGEYGPSLRELTESRKAIRGGKSEVSIERKDEKGENIWGRRFRNWLERIYPRN